MNSIQSVFKCELKKLATSDHDKGLRTSTVTIRGSKSVSNLVTGLLKPRWEITEKINMSIKGCLLIVSKFAAEMAPVANQLKAEGFTVTVSGNPKDLLATQYRNVFQNIILSIDLVDDNFLNHLGKVESFLNAPCTLFCEAAQSAPRLLRFNHDWKIFGKVDAAGIERTYLQARMKAATRAPKYMTKGASTNASNTTGPWPEVTSTAQTALEKILGANLKDQGPTVWKSLDWLTVQPIVNQAQGGYLLVGTDQESHSDTSRRLIAAWLKGFKQDHSGGFAVPFLKTQAKLLGKEGLPNNPYFSVKGNGSVVCGMGFVAEETPLPKLLRDDHGYCAFDMKCLIPNVTIPFDVHIYLPQNRKFLRLVKAGSLLTDDKFKQLQDVGRGEFHILSDQRLAFLQMTTFNSLRSSFAKKSAA